MGYRLLLKVERHTQWHALSVPFNLEHASMARSLMVEAFSVVRLTVGGTADGTRRSTVGTLNMFIWAGTGEALARHIASDVPSTSPTQGSNSGAHRES